MAKTLKRLTAFLLSLAIALGVPMTAFAAQDWYSIGDPLTYTSSLTIGNYTYAAGTQSKIMLLDDTGVAYCLQPDVMIGGNESDWLYQSGSTAPAWDALSWAQQNTINLLLLYGYPNQSLPGTKAEQYFATHNLIWEIVMKYRDSTHPYTRRDTRCYNAFSGHAGYVQAYKELEKRLTSHFIRPSFTMGVPSQAPTITLNYNASTGLYGTTVTDTNASLSSFRFVLGDVYLPRRSPSLLEISATKAQLDATAGQYATATKPLPNPISTGILVWRSVYNPTGNQTMITGGGAGDPVPAYFKLEIGEGYLQIRKTDTTHGGYFAGAVYGVYDSTGAKVTELTTSASGYVKSKALPLGHYYLQELRAPSGAILDTTKHEFDLETDGATVSLTVSDASQTANIQITKQGEVLTGASQSNSEFGSLYTPTYGTASLTGAVYEIYANEDIVSPGGKKIYSKNQLAATVNAGAKSPNLPLGQYRVVEKTAPSGFVLDTAPHIVNLAFKGQTVTVYTEPVTVTNQRQKVTVSLTKYIEENNLFPNPDAYQSIRFGIFAAQDFKSNSGSVVIPKDSLMEIISIDETLQGVSSADLPIGSYYLKEIQTAPGWVLDNTQYPFTFSAQPQTVQNITVEPNGGQPISNETVKGYVELTKADATYGGTLANAVYGIYTQSGAQAGTLTTDSTGYAKSGPLPYGSYYLQEVTAPDGAVIDPNQYPFTISDQAAIVTMNQEDASQQANILITKEGERLTGADQSDTEFGPQFSPVYGVETLTGAVYEIYANEDIYSPGGILQYNRDDLVATVNGGETSPDLPLGEYRVVEKTAPEGFILDTTPHIVDLTYKGQDITVYTEPVTVRNERQKVTVSITKAIEDNPIFPNPNAYQSVRFGIFAAQDFTDSSGTVVIPKDSLVEIFGIDETLQGISSVDLPIGSYYLKELQTAPGWVLNDTEFPFVFEAQPQEVPAVTIDPSGGEPIENLTVKGSIEISKLDLSSGQRLPGSKIQILDPDKTVVAEGITDETGILKVTLPYGTYFYLETEAPEGYVIDPTPYEFTISGDGEIIKTALHNRMISSEVEIHKVSSTDGKPLYQAGIRFRDAQGNIIAEGYTDETGVFSTILTYGEYTYEEFQAPEGFILDPTPYKIIITEDGKVIRETLRNDEKIELIATGDSRNTVFLGAVTAVSVAGAAYFFISRNRKKRPVEK